MIPAECLGKEGDEIVGSLAARKSAQNPRDIDVRIKYAFNEVPEQTVVYRIR
jgi:hypothetical protein